MRTIMWVMLVMLILLFILFNIGNSADLNVWPKVGDEQPVIIAGPMWAFALGFLLIGFVPMWLFNRAQSWRLKRRIASLENSLRAASTVAAVPAAEPVVVAPDAAPVAEPAPTLGETPDPVDERRDVP